MAQAIGYLMLVGALILFIRSIKARARPLAVLTSPSPPPSSRIWPEVTLAVLSFDSLMAETNTTHLLTAAKSTSGLNDPTWDGLLFPAIRNVAELVQLLPASESHHHAQPGGLWIHTLETIGYAIKLRLAVLLPPGREASDQTRHRYRWTVGVIIAALLHDVGKSVTDYRVRLYGASLQGAYWNALTSTMLEAGADDYAVDFPTDDQRDYQAHQRLGVILMQRLIPTKTRVYLGQDPELFNALLDYLSGEACDGNPIAVLVRQSEQQSVSENLKTGPRTRFTSARTVPLIERLMAALRRMLAEGGHLPLNRPGAAGFVFDGDVWFAAARLANSVRDYLVQRESAHGIPGNDKNDRLFDTWQDYGACRVNPASGRALWSGRIDFDDPNVIGFDLPAMLRFPLGAVFQSDHYPKPLVGKITVKQQHDPLPDPLPAKDEIPSTDKSARVVLPKLPKPFSPSKPKETTTVAVEETGAASTKSTHAALIETSHRRPSTPEPTVSELAQSNEVVLQTPAPPANEYLDEVDSASAVLKENVAPMACTVPQLLPVAPAMGIPKHSKTNKTPSPAAIEFMEWVQRSVSDGSLPYNTVTARVHFVKYGDATGILLVSPMIFREFEEIVGVREAKEDDMPGQAIQRAFSNANWHLSIPKGRKNIWSFQILRTSGKGSKLLNGFLILQPERFFNPVPPPNDRLQLWRPTVISPMSSSDEEKNELPIRGKIKATG